MRLTRLFRRWHADCQSRVVGLAPHDVGIVYDLGGTENRARHVLEAEASAAISARRHHLRNKNG